MAETSDAKQADPLDGLEERLLKHSRAFTSLLALTPAREYYGSHFVDGQDPSEQWNRKKQTKEQKRAAKKAKLDPANNKSALDVLKEREAEVLRKRKREEEGGGGGGDEDDVGQNGDEGVKRRKGEADGDAAEARKRRKAEKKKEKRQMKQERKQAQQAKKQERKARKMEEKQDRDLEEAQTERRRKAKGESEEEEDDRDDAEDVPVERLAEMDGFDVSGLANGDEAEWGDEEDGRDSHISSAPTTPVLNSPAFDLGTNHSTTSSSSSIIPPSTTDHDAAARRQESKAPSTASSAAATTATTTTETSSSKPHVPQFTDAEKHDRLRKRIEELRAARKADGPDGKPAKSRQELLEQRRMKDQQRKAHKKELRQKAKEEEARRQDEQLRGSGSPLSADIFSPRSPLPTDNAYSFSRLAFEDGTSADPSLAELKDARKRKGPSDARTALLSAQKKQSRIAGLDAEKRAGIEEKDMWLNARKRAHGERVRDDTSLLKKALKRKEKGKSKSEQQWAEREENVRKGKEAKQQRRETNLAKRKEEKGGKGKKSKPKGGAKGKAKGKKRAGFEGSFRA